MKLRYQFTLLALLLAILAWPSGPVQAQSGDTLVVEWEGPGGEPIRNALRNAIANDTNRPAGRVYKLRRGGFYWNEDRITNDGFHLRIVGETSAPSGQQDFGPPIIQRVVREDQSFDAVMIHGQDDVTLKNVWLMGMDDQGRTTAYEPLQLDASDARYTFDNVVFDRNDWHHIGVNGADSDIFITNSKFRNLFGPTQQWEGLGIRIEVGADTVVIENNTFYNIGFTPFQSEAAPANYVRFNHNTLVNIGRSLSAGSAWKEAYFTNNLFVNPFWHGAGAADLAGAEPDDDPFTGFFSIAALPSQFGTDLDRRIVLANNSYWRDPAFAAYYADSIRAQPLVNDTTMGYFERYSTNMVYRDNFLDANPQLTTYPDVVDSLIQNIRDLRAGEIPAARYYWDPGREEDCLVCNVWPLPENFTYANTTLQTAGTDGLPLGDLNWYPQAKATFEANQEAFVEEIEGMATALKLDIIATVEAEDAEVGGSGEVNAVEGFSYFFMAGGGYIEWTFDAPAAGPHSLRLSTNMRSETQRGQRIKVNGVNLRNNSNYGEYYFCTPAQAGCASPIPQNQWVVVDITAAGLIEGAAGLTLNQGSNTIRIEPSWGYQAFSGVDVVDASGAVVASLKAPDADYSLVEAICEDSEFCPSRFKAVGIDGAGSVSFDVTAPESGQYLLRIFYQAPNGSVDGQVLVNDQVVLSTVSLASEDSLGHDVITEQFAMSQGTNKITVSTTSGELNLDYVQVIGVNLGTGTAVEPEYELPGGFALDQNYPNPFNPSTKINFTIGRAGAVKLAVYDLMGRQVSTLLDQEMPAGTFEAVWDGRSATGAPAASGIYFYRLSTPAGQIVRSMVLMK